MTKLVNQLIKPESILIEQTALQMAAAFYEHGRSLGFTSKYKNPRDYAKKNVERFIPLAVNQLMDMLASDAISKEMKDGIYDAFLERANDPELSNNGIKAFENIFAETFVSDKVVEQKPVIWNTPTIDSFLGIDKDGKKN